MRNNKVKSYAFTDYINKSKEAQIQSLKEFIKDNFIVIHELNKWLEKHALWFQSGLKN